MCFFVVLAEYMTINVFCIHLHSMPCKDTDFNFPIFHNFTMNPVAGGSVTRGTYYKNIFKP